MTIDEFFSILTSLPVNWRFVGDTIRSYDAGFPSQSYSPLEVVCYFQGGTVSWRGGRTYKPSLLDMFFQHGEILGLPLPDVHAIFRASDNTSIDQPKSSQHTRDHEFRRRLIKACRLDPWRYKRENCPKKKHDHKTRKGELLKCHHHGIVQKKEKTLL